MRIIKQKFEGKLGKIWGKFQRYTWRIVCEYDLSARQGKYEEKLWKF